MSPVQDWHLMKVGVIACWQRPHRSPVILHPGWGTQCTSVHYKRERAHRRRYALLTHARADVFGYIECFHQRRLEAKDQALGVTHHPWKRAGVEPAYGIVAPRA